MGKDSNTASSPIWRVFLEFRHKHESWFEATEGFLTTVVFVLLFFAGETASHVAGLISHVIVGILLVIKIVSLSALELKKRFGKTYSF